VHVDQYGSGSPALLLIPGLTDSGTVWGTTVARYSSTHAIYVLTLPGFGGSAPVGAPMLDRVDSDPFARRKAGVLPTVARWRPNGKSANGRRFAPLHHA
jgi:pimeloyl-ACP methyl ester carboxylesterase